MLLFVLLLLSPLPAHPCPCVTRCLFLVSRRSIISLVYTRYRRGVYAAPGCGPSTAQTPVAISYSHSPKQKRHQSDSELNSRLAKVLQPDGTFADKKWKNIMVGDVLRLESDEFIPADVVLLSSSEPEGFCYIETSNLDGCVSCISRS